MDIVTATAGDEDDDYVDITIDVQDDSVSLHSVKPSRGTGYPVLTPDTSTLDRCSSFESVELTPQTSTLDRWSFFESAKYALKALEFISKIDGADGWPFIEKRFNEFAVDGSLPRSCFGQCIGMKNSTEFAGVLFDALARRRSIFLNSITIEQLKDFWDQISDQSFDLRLETFFDMVDMKSMWTINEEHIREIISLSDSANKLSTTKEQVEAYALLIMEELDPRNRGYIYANFLQTFLFQSAAAAYQSVLPGSLNLNLRRQKMSIEKLEPNSILRRYQKARNFLRIREGWWLRLSICAGLFACKFVQYRAVQILKVAVYPGGVMALRVTKPQDFNYQSGQYMFVHCPAVSPFKWHSFFITSAPQDDYISINMSVVGERTRRIKEFFSGAKVESYWYDRLYMKKEKKQSLLIHGPYGTPSQEYKKYEVVLLVGVGIGATPFISIVKDILSNLEQPEAKGLLDEWDLDEGYSGDVRLSENMSSNRTRAYFYWITQEQGSFEWFRGMMNEVAESDKQNAIELHNFCTSVFDEEKEGGARSLLLTMLQSLHHTKNSTTKVKTHFGRPECREIFKRIALHQQGKRIGVFYCGKPNLVKELKQLALDFSGDDGTKFDFHKENF